MTRPKITSKDVILTITDVRAFAGSHDLIIRPMTILVGENSTGKSTALACLAAGLDGRWLFEPPVLNRMPFELGGYDDIATRQDGLPKTEKFSFGIGISHESEPLNITWGFARDHRGRAVAKSFKISGAALELEARELDNEVSVTGHVRAVPVDVRAPAARVVRRQLCPLSVLELVRRQTRKKGSSVGTTLSVEVLQWLESWLFSIDVPLARALAPVRTKPQRTYDGLSSAVFAPEGSHVPGQIAERTNKQDTEAIRAFGRNSGLFREISVRQLGDGLPDPFQVLVEDEGGKSNLADVGYGVSQALPIVMEATGAPANAYLLVQQPEVHLHPRAQAELGTMFMKLAADRQVRFVVETHSDHFLDRVRRAVAEGVLAPSDVGILFFIKKAGKVTVCLIDVDERGDLVNAPPEYRQFFLEEEMQLLSMGT